MNYLFDTLALIEEIGIKYIDVRWMEINVLLRRNKTNDQLPNQGGMKKIEENHKKIWKKKGMKKEWMKITEKSRTGKTQQRNKGKTTTEKGHDDHHSPEINGRREQRTSNRTGKRLNTIGMS